MSSLKTKLEAIKEDNIDSNNLIDDIMYPVAQAGQILNNISGTADTISGLGGTEQDVINKASEILGEVNE